MSTWSSIQQWRDEMAAAESSYDRERSVSLLNLDPSFFASHFDEVLTHVLVNVAPAWFTATQVPTSGISSNPLLDAIDALLSVQTAQTLAVHHARPIQTLFLTLTAWQPAWSDVTCLMCGRALQDFVGRGGVSHLFSELLRQKANEASADIVVTRIGAIPAKMHNLYRHETPTCFVPYNYYAKLVQAFLTAMRSQTTTDDNTHTEPAMITRLFLLKLSRQAQLNAFVKGWLDDPSHPQDSHLAKMLPSICFASLVPSVIAHLDAAQHTSAIPAPSWLNLLVGHPICQHELTKLVLHTPLHVQTHRMLAHVLYSTQSTSTEPSTPFDTVFHRVVVSWSSISTNSAETKRCVSTAQFLTAGLALLSQSTTTPKAILEQHGWIEYLCKGVQEHMGHALGPVRHSAMRVATALSRILTPESPLQFHDLPPDEHDSVAQLAEDSMSRTMPTEAHAHPPEQNDVVDGRPSDKHTHDDEDDEFDAVVRSDSEDDDNVDERQSDVSLEPYDDLSDTDDDAQELSAVPDESNYIDLVLARRPPLVYLWQVKEGLIAEDNRDATEVALASLPRIIARQPHDLPHMAVEIATVLLRLEDAFQTPHFDSLRRQSLVGLCVHVPDVVTPMLCAYIYDNQRLFQTKLDILQAVGDASSEIRSTPMRARKSLHNAAQFFFPLLNPLHAKLMQLNITRLHGDQDKPTWGDSHGRHVLDDLLMAHVLQTLSRVLEATGPHYPAVLTMGKRFLELLWSQRNHELPSVRRQIFFGLSRVLLVLPSFAWQEEVDQLNLGPQLVPFLQHHTAMDPDGGCRAAAKLLLATVTSTDQRFN
ncbi:hypothetical protein H310_01765 [Aphanomyces invadans]|uniref:Telomere length regulation protein conserved domain-containing protein n=1 Tax=Aphanomyces invadans TaxID=157072 RepID=A0A024UL11_9STRA|nr:hypothetical protein H310_01765 [Aphanomyces invadans]ETW07136.1 hypothetical protein H310_01765 [Aphanomyces invadans]|eukprot:XP_008863229.1 hypothetical protein H310_01765 [Aphanomyces invadans]